MPFGRAEPTPVSACRPGPFDLATIILPVAPGPATRLYSRVVFRAGLTCAVPRLVDANLDHKSLDPTGEAIGSL